MHSVQQLHRRQEVSDDETRAAMIEEWFKIKGISKGPWNHDSIDKEDDDVEEFRAIMKARDAKKI